MTDPRISLGPELAGSAGDATLQRLDQLRPVVRVDADLHPAAATAAAALVVILARTFPHTTVDGDAALGPNPWGASSVVDALAKSSAAVPAPSTEPTEDFVIAVGATSEPAQLHIGGDDWTAHVSEHPVECNPQFSALGIHAAACFAAAEVLKHALQPLGMLAVPHQGDFTWNLLNHRLEVAEALEGRRRSVRVAFLGCGSVGSSAVGVLTCINGLTGHGWLVDPDTVDPERNPYRYPTLTGTESGHKAHWLSRLLESAGWTTTEHLGDVASWVAVQPAPGLHGLAVSSVDTVEGRRDVADLLAHTTLSAGVAGLALHIQVEHPADEFACPYCDFADLRSALEEAALRAQFIGLPEERIVQLTVGGELLTAEDLAAAVNAGRVHPERVDGLIGRRLDDLIRRAYAEAAIPAGEATDAVKPAAVSAPYVSWFTGVLLAAEIDKASLGLPALDRRVDVDLAGIPLGVTSKTARDRTGRCTCAQTTRRDWASRLYA